MSLVISEFEPWPELRGVVRRAADYHECSAPRRRLEARFVGVVVSVSLGPDMEIDGRRTGSFVAGVWDRPTVTGHYGEKYADQPHFNRDFRELVGRAPGEFPFVQDALAAV